MRSTLRPLLVSVTLIAGALLWSAGASAIDPLPPKSATPPPPGMNDPGVTARTTNAAPSESPAVPAAADDPLAPPPKPDSRLVRDKASRDASAVAQRVASSQVTTRKQGTDTVEEYRDQGHVWMIKIVPVNGLTQTFMDTDGSGRLARDPHAGPISPVYYTLYEWK